MSRQSTNEYNGQNVAKFYRFSLDGSQLTKTRTDVLSTCNFRRYSKPTRPNSRMFSLEWAEIFEEFRYDLVEKIDYPFSVHPRENIESRGAVANLHFAILVVFKRDIVVRDQENCTENECEQIGFSSREFLQDSAKSPPSIDLSSVLLDQKSRNDFLNGIMA